MYLDEIITLDRECCKCGVETHWEKSFWLQTVKIAEDILNLVVKLGTSYPSPLPRLHSSFGKETLSLCPTPLLFVVSFRFSLSTSQRFKTFICCWVTKTTLYFVFILWSHWIFRRDLSCYTVIETALLISGGYFISRNIQFSWPPWMFFFNRECSFKNSFLAL